MDLEKLVARIPEEHNERIETMANEHGINKSIMARAVVRTGLACDDLELRVEDYPERAREGIRSILKQKSNGE